MARYTSARALADAQRRRSLGVGLLFAANLRTMATEIRQDAVELTSGTVSEKQLRQMGHPFARRGVRRGRTGTLPKLPINRQTGELQSSLKTRFVRQGEKVWLSVWFASPHAIVLRPGGTLRMVMRPFWQEMTQRHIRRMIRFNVKVRSAMGR